MGMQYARSHRPACRAFELSRVGKACSTECRSPYRFRSSFPARRPSEDLLSRAGSTVAAVVDNPVVLSSSPYLSTSDAGNRRKRAQHQHVCSAAPGAIVGDPTGPTTTPDVQLAPSHSAWPVSIARRVQHHVEQSGYLASSRMRSRSPFGRGRRQAAPPSPRTCGSGCKPLQATVRSRASSTFVDLRRRQASSIETWPQQLLMEISLRRATIEDMLPRS